MYWVVNLRFVRQVSVFLKNQPGELAKLFNSIERIYNPPISSEAVSQELLEKANGMENNEIENFVREKIPFQYDWETFNLPWYYPRVEEVLANETGDCKSRMILLASIFEALEENYEFRYSFNHFWLHYDKKEEGYIERDEVYLYSDEEGFQLPDFQLDVTYRSYKNFMELMPLGRKILFLAGFFVPYWIERSVEDEQVLMPY